MVERKGREEPDGERGGGEGEGEEEEEGGERERLETSGLHRSEMNAAESVLWNLSNSVQISFTRGWRYRSGFFVFPSHTPVVSIKESNSSDSRFVTGVRVSKTLKTASSYG